MAEPGFLNTNGCLASPSGVSCTVYFQNAGVDISGWTDSASVTFSASGAGWSLSPSTFEYTKLDGGSQTVTGCKIVAGGENMVATFASESLNQYDKIQVTLSISLT